jgi:hypothetical protein
VARGDGQGGHRAPDQRGVHRRQGGLFGGTIIPGVLHKGGVAGVDGYGTGRSVPAAAFAAARRYHSGGVAGLLPGEVPAILQRGETVLPKGARQGVHVTVGVSVDNSGELQAYVQRVATGTAAATTRAYDRGLADRVAQINSDPRFRG